MSIHVGHHCGGGLSLLLLVGLFWTGPFTAAAIRRHAWGEPVRDRGFAAARFMAGALAGLISLWWVTSPWTYGTMAPIPVDLSEIHGITDELPGLIRIAIVAVCSAVVARRLFRRPRRPAIVAGAVALSIVSLAAFALLVTWVVSPFP